MSFFQCNVNIIENAISDYANNNVFMLHDDKIAHVAIEKKLKWFQKNNLFSITDMNLEIFLMNQALLTKLSNGCRYLINIIYINFYIQVIFTILYHI